MIAVSKDDGMCSPRNDGISTDSFVVILLSQGARKGTAGGLAIGASLVPLFLGRMEPSATKAMASSEESFDRSLC